MRLVGILLVVVGAIALGVHGFGTLFRERPTGDQVQAAADRSEWVAPVVSGIAVTAGLLLLATDGRRE